MHLYTFIKPWQHWLRLFRERLVQSTSFIFTYIVISMILYMQFSKVDFPHFFFLHMVRQGFIFKHACVEEKNTVLDVGVLTPCEGFGSLQAPGCCCVKQLEQIRVKIALSGQLLESAPEMLPTCWRLLGDHCDRRSDFVTLWPSTGTVIQTDPRMRGSTWA